jgi:hypothetical protein
VHSQVPQVLRYLLLYLMLYLMLHLMLCMLLYHKSAWTQAWASSSLAPRAALFDRYPSAVVTEHGIVWA